MLVFQLVDDFRSRIESANRMPRFANLSVKTVFHNKAQLVQYAIQKKIIKIPNLE